MTKDERKVKSILLQKHWKLSEQGKHIVYGNLNCLWVNAKVINQQKKSLY